jgi:hypothetical protein
MDTFLQSKYKSIFGIIVDLQRIQIDKFTIQKKTNISIISIFDQLKKREKSFK